MAEVSDKPQQPVDFHTLTNLLKDPVIIRIVIVLDIAKLSILELLEYDLTRNDVNHALIAGVIEIDKSTEAQISNENTLLAGDFYFYQYLNSKVRLTELGKYILDLTKECGCQTLPELIEKAAEMFESGAFATPDRPQGPK